MLNIELSTRVIDKNKRIWVVFPGQRRQYYQQFLLQKIIFLDYPELNLGRNSVEDIGRIRQHVRMSNRFAEYLTGGFGGSPPSLDPSRYDSANFKEGVNRVKVANIKKIFDQIKIGDLVIVPGTIFDPILFGEVSSKFNPEERREINSKQITREVQFRDIEWYRTDVMRSDLPRNLQMYISKPPAIARVPRDEATERFFHFAYDSYILNDFSFELFRAPTYSGKDPRETEDANRLISYFISAYAAIEKGKLEHFLDLGFDEAIEEFYDETLVGSYTQVFRSPGQFGLLAAAVLLGGFVSVCTTLSVSNISSSEIKSGVKITNLLEDRNLSTENSELEVRINYLLKSMDKEKLEVIKKKGDRARKNLSLRSKARIQ